MGAVYVIEIREGEKVAMLFTPRLYTFKGTEGVTFEQEGEGMVAIHSLYADVMYCAAMNHWTMTHTADEAFPYDRMDFHEFSMLNRKSFEKALIFAMETLSGKSVRELMENAKKSAENPKESASEEKEHKDVKKKSLCGWITNLLRRS